jgi:hypothetical protein
MFDLTSRPARARRTPPDDDVALSVSVAGLQAALKAASLGLLTVMVVVLVGWATAADSGASATEAVAGALQVWLGAQHTELAVGSAAFQVVPLGLLVGPAWLLFATSVRAARASRVVSPRGAVALTAVVTATYAVLAVLVSLLARTDVVRPAPISAFLGAAGVAAVAGGAGVVHGGVGWAGVWRRLPAELRLVLRGCLGVLCVLGGGGALVAGLALLAGLYRARALLVGLHPGATGGLIVVLLCIAYLPTAVVWAVAYVAGPGFAVGSGTAVTVSGSHLGAVPAFPLLAALPAGGGGLGPVVFLLPVAAGVVAALLAGRLDRSGSERLLGSWRGLLVTGLGTGAASGAAFGVLSVLASGPIGPGRMATVGPAPLVAAAAVAAWVGGSALAALVVRNPGVLRRHRDG